MQSWFGNLVGLVGPGRVDVAAAIEVWANRPEPSPELARRLTSGLCAYSRSKSRGDRHGIMTGDDEAARAGCPASRATLGARPPGSREFPTCRDARASRVEPQDRRHPSRAGAATGYASCGEKLTEVMLEAAGAMGPNRCITVVVARE